MSLLKTFHSSTPNDNDNTRMDACYKNIKFKITQQCGIADFIEKDGWIAFSGSLEKPQLLLTLSIMKTDGKHYLYADIDDEISWQEWDFENQEDFENAVVEYVSPLINRTIKTVIEKKKHKYIKTSRYYLSDNNEWVLIDVDVADYTFLKLFITKNSIKEDIMVYQLCK